MVVHGFALIAVSNIIATANRIVEGIITHVKRLHLGGIDTRLHKLTIYNGCNAYE
jgi:hypothetical protein